MVRFRVTPFFLERKDEVKNAYLATTLVQVEDGTLIISYQIFCNQPEILNTIIAPCIVQ